MSKKHFLKGTIILTCAGLITRFIGFFYRIFLSHSIGAQGMGVFQLVMPLQMLVLAITASGIHTALSRLVAARMAVGKDREARDFLLTGAALAFALSFCCSLILYKNSLFFAVEILREVRTEPLIRLLAPGIPLSALHMCINSYYYARKKTELPSCIQLFEQLVRVGVTYLLFLIFLSEGREITPVIAAGGALASEGAAALVSLFAIGLDFHKNNYSPAHLSLPVKKLREIFHIALPLTTNRILLTLLGSIEVVLIPQRLCMSGLSSGDALGIYGVFTGMVLPLILFPSTITNSASVMLMPSIAELQALGYRRRIRYVTSSAGRYCMLLGTGCALLFFFFGEPLGQLLFNSPTAGAYIKTLSFICPFLYLNTALSSILNGLGRAGTCLVHSVAGLSLRIGFVLFAIPLLGIRGYLYGILISELLLTLLHTLALAQCETKPSQRH